MSTDLTFDEKMEFGQFIADQIWLSVKEALNLDYGISKSTIEISLGVLSRELFKRYDVKKNEDYHKLLASKKKTR